MLHGHADPLLVKAGSGALTLGNPSSAGVTPETAGHTTVLAFNDTQQLEDAFRRHGDEIAAVIVEPVAGNITCVPGTREFLQAMRALCTRHGAVLVFDEVMTGFPWPGRRAGALRHHARSHDARQGDRWRDAGRRVRRPARHHGENPPLGPVYQAGTLSGNPVAVAAGLATLKLVLEPGFFDRLAARTASLVEGLNGVAKRRGVAFSAAHVGGMFGVFFRPTPPVSYAEVMQSDSEAFNRFFMPCSAQAYISRHPLTRRGSSRPPTAKRRSPPPCWPQTRCSGAPHDRACDHPGQAALGGHRPALVAHSVKLADEDRRLRFGTPRTDHSLAEYVESLDFDRDAVFGVFDDDLRLAASRTSRCLEFAELGVSVLPAARQHGNGTALFERANLFARTHYIPTMFTHCLTENRTMMRIASKAGMVIVTEAGEADARLELPPAGMTSITPR